MKRIDPVITSGQVHGICPRCGQPYLGQMDADIPEIQLICIGCGHKGFYKYQWPDELPKVILRHASSGQLVGNRKKKKRIKRNKDGVLPGQLSFSEIGLKAHIDTPEERAQGLKVIEIVQKNRSKNELSREI